MSGDINNWPYPEPTSAGVDGTNFDASGTPVSFEWRQTILSQYADSDRIIGLIESFFAAIDQTANFDAFYQNIWDLDTAQGYGLDVWGRIVGVNRVLQVPAQQYFGFAEAGDALPFGNAQNGSLEPHFGFKEAGDAQPFGQAPFGEHPISGVVDPNAGGGIFYIGGKLTNNYSLSDQAYRRLIYAKASANITDGSIPSINGILLRVFAGRGNCYVQDGIAHAYFGFAEAKDAQPFGQAPFFKAGNTTAMVMQYVFNFPLTPVDRAIVAQSGVLPKPVGVAASVTILA